MTVIELPSGIRCSRHSIADIYIMHPMRLLTTPPASGTTIAMPLPSKPMRKALAAVANIIPGGADMTARERALLMAQLAADMQKAEAEAIRRGLLDDYQGDGTWELTEAVERYFFEWLASSEHTRH
jgi:hypothetical protein